MTSFYVFGFGKGVFWILEAQGVEFDSGTADLLVKSLAIAVCVVFIMINYRGTKETGRSGIAITLVLIGIILTFIVSGVIYIMHNPGGQVGEIVDNPVPNGLPSILIAMGFTFIVFEGYEIISQCGEECKDPLKNVPRASWLCITISTLIFIAVAVVTIGIVDWTTIGAGLEVAGDDAVAHAAGLTIPGGLGTVLIGIGVILGTLAAINSTLFSSSRVSFAMGRDGALPRAFGRLHSKRSTPYVAVLTSGAIVVSMTLFLPIEEIAAAADIMFLLLFFFVNLTAITLRVKRPDIKRHFLMPLFPWVPIIGIITKLVLAVGLWWEFERAWFIALGWITVGMVTFYFYGGKKLMETVTPEPVGKGIIGTIMERPEEKAYKILVPVVREDQKPLIEFAALVARVEDADLHVATVVELPYGSPLDSLRYKDTAGHIKLIERLKRASDRELVKSRGSVLISHAASDAILDTIREEGINLLVIGWKGRTREGRIFGTTIDRLVQGAECDVIVFRTIGLGKEVKRILVISTPEMHVSYATGYAVLLAKRDEAKITIFSASPDEQSLEKERAYAYRLAGICHTHEVEHEVKVVVARDAYGAIVEESGEYDLVVMGASAEWEQRRFAFGSLQDRVARELGKPVLVMRKVRPRP